MVNIDVEAMKMFAQEGDVFHIEEEPAKDLATMIMPSDGITSFWSFQNNFPNEVFNGFESFIHVFIRLTQGGYLINHVFFNFWAYVRGLNLGRRHKSNVGFKFFFFNRYLRATANFTTRTLQIDAA